MEQTAEQPRKRRGRPPKKKAGETNAGQEIMTITPTGDAPLMAQAGRGWVKVEKLPRPSAPMLAKEIVDFVISRYDWKPGDWRVLLTSLAYVQRLGRYWSEQTRK